MVKSSKKTAGALIGLMSLTGVLSQPLAGTLSDRIGRSRMISIALVIAGISVALFPYLNGTFIFLVAFVAGFALLGTVPVLDAITA
ncbi:MAG: MFS transporter, partial [Pseudomonadota bacterium]